MPSVRALKRSVCLTAIVVYLAGIYAAAAEVRQGTLAVGTPWETPYYVQDTGLPGPTIMIVGGMHGNEPAGAYAAEQIRRWPIVRGKVVAVPRANQKALAAVTRYTPGADAPLKNLNRNFPRAGEAEGPRGTLAAEIWKLVDEHRPQWLLDLHEGYDFNQLNSDSVGSTLIVHPSPDANEAAELMLAAVNQEIENETKKFVRRGPPINGSLARAAAEHRDIRAMILETTSKDQPLSLRARQHRLMMYRLLMHLNVLDSSVTMDSIADRDETTLDIALYDAGGTGGAGVPRVTELLGQFPDMNVVRLGPDEIRNGALKQFRVVVFTGGSGSRQANALGEAGRRQVQQFVSDGGGYIGICAGSYLACDGFSWGLKVLDARTVSPKWRRGRGTVKMELTDLGRQVFGEGESLLSVRYANGPILTPNFSEAIDDYRPLAIFRSELAENGTPAGVMIDSPAIVSGTCGRGRVLCISPHPEQTDGLEHFVPRAVRWVADSGSAHAP